MKDIRELLVHIVLLAIAAVGGALNALGKKVKTGAGIEAAMAVIDTGQG